MLTVRTVSQQQIKTRKVLRILDFTYTPSDVVKCVMIIGGFYAAMIATVLLMIQADKVFRS